MRVLPLLAICTVVACATPYDQCIRDATRDANTLSALIAESEANLARGYAIEETVEPRIRYRYCFNRHGIWTLCRERDIVRKRDPVAIDLEAEERKLAGMRAKLSELKIKAGRDIRACRAQFPQG